MNRNRDDNQLIVTFYDSDQHTVLKKEYVDKCGSATPPKDPTRPGKSFAGWVGRYEEVACNENVYATYNDIDYVVTFKSHDGIILKTQHVAYGGSAKEPPIIPVWEGHSFTGWDKPFSYITEDTVVTALYDANTIKLTFVKYKDEEEPWFDVDIPVGTSYTLPDPEDGDVAWSFDYWVGNKDIYTQDTTIIARYKDAEETSYTYEFYEPLPGGQWAKITSFEHSGNIAWEDLYEEFVEDKIEVSTAFYKLLGWAETQGSKEKINDDKVFSGGRFYAIVKELPYEIQFVEYELEDGDYQEYKAIVNCKAGEAFNVPDFNTDPTFKKYEGLTFKQWEPFYTSSNVEYFRRGVKTFNLPTTATSGLQEDDRVYMTYQARFENKIYKVTFVNYDYSLVKEFYCEYGHSVPDADVPQPTKKPNPDAIFTGWIGSWKNVIQDTVIIAGFGETPRYEVKYYANRTYGPFTGSTPTLLYTDIVDDGAASEYTADEDIKNSMVYQNRTGNTSSWTFGNWKYEDGIDADLTEVTEDKVVYLDATPVTVTIKWLAKVVDPSNPFAQWEPVYNYKVLNNTLYNNADRYNAVSPESDDWSYYFTGPVTYETAYYKHSDGSVFDPTQGATEQIDCKVTFTPASYTINFYVGTDLVINGIDITLPNKAPTNLVYTDSITINDDLVSYSGSDRNLVGMTFLGWSLSDQQGSTVVLQPNASVWLQQFVNNNNITGTTINLYGLYSPTVYTNTTFTYLNTLSNLPEPGAEGTQTAISEFDDSLVIGTSASDIKNHTEFSFDTATYRLVNNPSNISVSSNWVKGTLNGILDYWFIPRYNTSNYIGLPIENFSCPFKILTYLKSDEQGNDYWSATDVTAGVGDTINLYDYMALTDLHKDWRITQGSDLVNFEQTTVGSNPNCFKRNRDNFLYYCDEKTPDDFYYLVTRQNPEVIYIVENRNVDSSSSTIMFYWNSVISNNNSTQNSNELLHSKIHNVDEKELTLNTDWSLITPTSGVAQTNFSTNKWKDASGTLTKVYDYIWMILFSTDQSKILFIDDLNNLTAEEKQDIYEDGNCAAFGFSGVFKPDPDDHTNLIKGWAHFYYTDTTVDYDTFDIDDVRVFKVYEDADSTSLNTLKDLVSRNVELSMATGGCEISQHNKGTLRLCNWDSMLLSSTGYINYATNPSNFESSSSLSYRVYDIIPVTFDNVVDLFNWSTDNKELFKFYASNGIVTSETILDSKGYKNIEIGIDSDNNFGIIHNVDVIETPSYGAKEKYHDRVFDIKGNYFNPEDSENYSAKLERYCSPLNIAQKEIVVNTKGDNNDNSDAWIEMKTTKEGSCIGLPSLYIFDIDKKYNEKFENISDTTDAINRFVVYYAGRDHVFDICIPAGGFFAPKALAPENANYGFLDIVWEDFRTHEEVDDTYIENFNRTLGTSSSVAYIFVAKSFRIGAKLFLTRNDIGYRGFNEIYNPAGTNKLEGPAVDKWKVLPTDTMTPCILYDFNQTVEENMTNPWIIAGNTSYTFNYKPFISTTSYYNKCTNETIAGNGFLNTVFNHSKDLASGVCFKQKYNIINNWKNVDFERIWTAIIGIKRSDYSNRIVSFYASSYIDDYNIVNRIPIGAQKIYDSALYYYPFSTKPMEEENFSSTALDNWSNETSPIAIPGSITEDDYTIHGYNFNLYNNNPGTYFAYKNGNADFYKYSTLGYDANSSSGYRLYNNYDVKNTNNLINSQCELSSIYYSDYGYIWGIYEQNKFRWYKDYDACLSIFEEVIDNLDMSEYESGTIINSNYIDNSTSTYTSFSATTSSSKVYSLDNFKMNTDIPRIEFNYNIYREVSSPIIDGLRNKRESSDYRFVYQSVHSWGLNEYVKNKLPYSYLREPSVDLFYDYVIHDISTVYIRDFAFLTNPYDGDALRTRSHYHGSSHSKYYADNEYLAEEIANNMNNLFKVMPITSAYTELFAYPVQVNDGSIFTGYANYTVSVINENVTTKDLFSNANVLTVNAFSEFKTSGSDMDLQPIFVTNDSDEDLPDFYNYVDLSSIIYSQTCNVYWDSHEHDGETISYCTFELLNGNQAIPGDSSYKMIVPHNNSYESYEDVIVPKYYSSNAGNRQALCAAYLVKLNENRYTRTAPTEWGEPSGGVTGFTNEPNQQLRQSLGLTTDFEIDWSEKFKNSLISMMETVIFVKKHSFTVNIYRKSDNKKLAHYTATSENLSPYLLIGVARRYEGTSVRRFCWRDSGNCYIPMSEDYITDAKSNGIIRNGNMAVEGTDYVFVPMSGLNQGDTVDFTIDGVVYTCELSRKITTNSDPFALYTKNFDYSC